MTQDVVALVQGRPDPRATVAAMAAAGPGLRVRHAADGAVLQLCESGGPPLVSIEVPLFLQVPGEIERLLGTEVARHVPLPVWWVEARAAKRAAAGPIAGRFAAELAGRLGGRVWRHPAGPATGLPAADAGGADAANLPGVDLLTERAALVVQNRPVVPLTAWLAEALRHCGESGRALQILTPPGARLTLPLRLTLAAQNGRWVVRNAAAAPAAADTDTDTDTGADAAAAADDAYDGLTGAALRWDGAAYTPIEAPAGGGTLAAAFTRVPVPVGEQLICTFRASHPAAGDTRIGGAVELLCAAITGTPPGGWGTAEPATQAWHREELTAFCRERAPNPTWLVVVGGLGPRRVVGTIFVSRTPRGVEEAVTLVAGERAGGGADAGGGGGGLPALVDQERLTEVAGRLVTEAGVESLFVQRAVEGPDGTTVPHWTGRPGPVGMALSDRAAREVGLDRAMHPPDVPVTRIGGGQGVWYALGDGVATESGLRMQRLTQHLSGGGQVN
jgi:hypothetical protein